MALWGLRRVTYRKGDGGGGEEEGVSGIFYFIFWLGVDVEA